MEGWIILWEEGNKTIEYQFSNEELETNIQNIIKKLNEEEELIQPDENMLYSLQTTTGINITNENFGIFIKKRKTEDQDEKKEENIENEENIKEIKKKLIFVRTRIVVRNLEIETKVKKDTENLLGMTNPKEHLYKLGSNLQVICQ